MRLADFIEQNTPKIIEGAEAFAKTVAPPRAQLNTTALRNDIPEILSAVVQDLRTDQSPFEQLIKSEGRAPEAPGPESAASSHGRTRAKLGFNLNSMIAEYRALRAAVLRLWAEDKTLTSDSIEDMIRFNEAIDQAIAESLMNFSKEVESWRNIFLGVLGHDLRGPLAAIATTSEVLSRMTESSSYHVLAERIVLSCMHMSKLLDNLLVFSKAQLGMGFTVDISMCDLGNALRDEVDLLRNALPKAMINFCSEGSTQGLFDASRMREVLHNLVTNAFKYGDPGTEIVVSLESTPDEVQLTVCNAGPPLPSKWSESMFDPLQRGLNAAHNGEKESLGLGLYVVQEIVKAHGGNVTASSADGKTKFAVWLPIKAT